MPGEIAGIFSRVSFKVDKKGYVYIYYPSHPRAVAKYVRRSHLVVEKFIGRYLVGKEMIHHIDLNKHNDNLNNLMIFKSVKEHSSFHVKLRQFGVTNPIRRQIENRWEEYGKKI